VLVQGASVNDVVEMVAFDIFSVNDSVSAKDGGSFAGTVGFGAGIAGGVVFNEAGADVDFRVESDTITHALFVNGADGKIGIGESAPSEMLHIKDDTNDDAFGGLIIKSNNGTANVKYGWRGADGSDQLRLATGGNLALNIDSAGIITKPLQPAFLAHPSSTQSNIAVGSDITVLFATEIFDQNADFNTANYTFTAPVTGRYQFNIVYYLENIDTATGYYYIFFDTSNRNYFNIISPAFTADTSYLSLTLSMLVDMDASDTALCKIRQSHGTSQTDISGNSFFSGYLVA
jgi:hypothetical protein